MSRLTFCITSILNIISIIMLRYAYHSGEDRRMSTASMNNSIFYDYARACAKSIRRFRYRCKRYPDTREGNLIVRSGVLAETLPCDPSIEDRKANYLNTISSAAGKMGYRLNKVGKPAIYTAGKDMLLDTDDDKAYLLEALLDSNLRTKIESEFGF